MDKIKLIFGVHNHQPVGNFDHVFEEVFQKCYKLYLNVLKHYSKIKTAIHFSGPLLEWIKDNQPDYLKLVRELAESGRLEVLSGGFYEPILSSLPERDAIGQIRMMNEFIKTEFGQTPRGLWLAERVWSPILPKIIAQADIKYTIVDDTHFYYSGLEENQIQGYFITETQGYSVYVFPINKSLRYSIPFELPEKTLERIRDFKENGFEGVTYADDGEKFGSWPDTYEWVYEKNYLNNLFISLEANLDWLEVTTFGDYIDQYAPVGRIYLPMASYEEMMEWSLPLEASSQFEVLKEKLPSLGLDIGISRRFLRGGHWDNFFTKYEESNNLHKKMLYVSEKLNQLPLDLQKSSGALRELYRGQCNCAQWHGLFGGLYLNYLRHALYQHLIGAENLADELLGEKNKEFQVRSYDINKDGRDEILVSNREMNCYLSPSYGGVLYELEFRPTCFNLSNILRRRPESYHRVLKEQDKNELTQEGQPKSIHDQVRLKEEDLQNKLIYDQFERYSFMDHFLEKNCSFEDFKTNKYLECGNFLGTPFDIKGQDWTSNNDYNLILFRKDQVLQNGEKIPVTLQKKFKFFHNSADIEVEYVIENDSEKELNQIFGVELNFTLLAGESEDRYLCFSNQPEDHFKMGSEGCMERVSSLKMQDEYFKFKLLIDINPQCQFWWYPLETVSQSEHGLESVYQGTCFFGFWDLLLPPGEKEKREIRIKLEKLELA